MPEIEKLKEQNQQLKEQNQQLTELVESQRLQIEWLKNQLFGSKSERLDPNQNELFEQGVLMGKPEAPLDSEKTSKREEPKSKEPRTRRSKDKLGQRNLPVIIKEVLVPEEVRENPELFRKIDERYHDEFDYQRARLQWQRTVIEEYVRIDTPAAPPVRAAAPVAPIAGAKITPSLAAAIVIDKHCDHLPHYRQSQRFFREQSVSISYKTINSWAISTAKHLAPIAQSIGQELLSTGLLQVDETTMKYLQQGKDKAQTGYIWIMRDPASGLSYYHWHTNRNTDALLELLGYNPETEQIGFQGTIQCDGYTCYETLNNLYKGITLGACMAHIRRKFIDDPSLKSIPWVRELLENIQALYAIEKRLRHKNAPPDMVLQERKSHSTPLIERIEELLRTNQANYRPSSSCAKAISYALGQWNQWKEYLHNGKLPIDNNGVENAVRPCKLGLKNYMFFGSIEGGHYNCTLYTLIEGCKAVGLNVRDYLEHVIIALHHTPASELTPSKVAELWQKAERNTA